VLIAPHAAVWLLAVRPAFAQCEQAKLTASDAVREQQFGGSVGISGDVAVVGASGGGWPGGPGAAYVYRRYGLNWIEQQKLIPSDLQEGSVLGWAVAVSGDNILVTAPGHSAVNPGDGAAYVFRYNGVGWLETQKLYPSDGFSGWHLGQSAAIDGDVAAVGQIGDSFAGAPESGAVYVYRWNGTSWVQEQKLAPPDLGYFDHFGTSVSISGNLIVGGAPQNEPHGAAYVFHWNGSTWVQEQKLTISQNGPGFGNSVAVWGATALVGRPDNGTPNPGPGTVSVFRYNGLSWLETQTLTASDGGPADFFGDGVSVHGNRLLVHAVGVPDPGTPLGVVYVYEFGGEQWIEKLKLTARSDVGQYGGFGMAALGARYAVLGAAGDDNACPTDPYCNSGAAYIYDVELCLTGIPAVSTWGLVALTVSVLLAGVLLLRRSGAFAQKGLGRKDAVPEPVKEIAHEKNTCSNRHLDAVGHSRAMGGGQRECAPTTPATDQTGGGGSTAV
jgi:hypothetical protein